MLCRDEKRQKNRCKLDSADAVETRFMERGSRCNKHTRIMKRGRKKGKKPERSQPVSVQLRIRGEGLLLGREKRT